MTTISSKRPEAVSKTSIIKLQTKSGEFDFRAAVGERLLYAGLSEGLTLPYECATGTCGTCRARIMTGKAETTWPAAPGLARLNPAKGDVLLCQARAHEDCLVRVPASVGRLTDGTRPQRRGGIIDVVRKLTNDVTEFEVGLSEPIAFEAGQFCVIDTGAVDGGRAYSMVNHGSAVDRLVFVVKKKPGGGFSEWLFEGPANQAEVGVFGPLGRATFRPSEGRDLVLIAGGSGVAGMMSILAQAAASGFFSSHRARLFFGVRRMTDGFYLKELESLARAAAGRLEVTLALSDEPAQGETHADYAQIKLASGFVHEVAGRALAQDSSAMTAFVAGPPPLVDGALRMLLTQARVPAEFIRYDKFS